MKLDIRKLPLYGWWSDNKHDLKQINDMTKKGYFIASQRGGSRIWVRKR